MESVGSVASVEFFGSFESVESMESVGPIGFVAFFEFVAFVESFELIGSIEFVAFVWSGSRDQWSECQKSDV